jgi:DNA polymerase-4
MGRGPHAAEEVDATLAGLVDRVTRRMRAANRPGRTITLRLRFDDFTRATRSRTLLRDTVQTQTILDAARGLMATAQPMIAERGLTLVGISVGQLENDRPLQLQLPFRGRDEGLDATIDDIRDRFGKAALTRAVLVDRNEGLSMPMLPD